MPTNSTEATPPVPVLWQDEHLLVIDKPAGVPAQPDTTGDPDVLTLLAGQLGVPPLSPVHRLDRPVSGAMVVALRPEAKRALDAAFRERRVEKWYWAIVEDKAGRELGERLELHHLLQHDTRRKRAVVVPAAATDDRAAVLRIVVLARGEHYTLLEVRPLGGAFHQIRAQLAAAGMPIKGDVKYGARRGEPDRSIALHARGLRFTHPVLGGEFAVEAPAPEKPLWRALAGIV
jgi:23S rRNA pseudouridine1911/1915/1917 synthase